jgi:hypothetical protein
VRFFIVSQTNPHLIPLLAIRKTVASLPGGQWLQWVGRQMENEFKMRCGQVKMVMGSGLLFWGASLFFQVGRNPLGRQSLTLQGGAHTQPGGIAGARCGEG